MLDIQTSSPDALTLCTMTDGHMTLTETPRYKPSSAKDYRSDRQQNVTDRQWIEEADR